MMAKIQVKDFNDEKRGPLSDDMSPASPHMIVTPLFREITYKPPELLVILQITMQIQPHMWQGSSKVYIQPSCKERLGADFSHSKPCLTLCLFYTHYQSNTDDGFVQRRLHEIMIWYNTDDINDMYLSSTVLCNEFLKLLQRSSRIPCNCIS